VCGGWGMRGMTGPFTFTFTLYLYLYPLPTSRWLNLYAHTHTLSQHTHTLTHTHSLAHTRTHAHIPGHDSLLVAEGESIKPPAGLLVALGTVTQRVEEVPGTPARVECWMFRG
jgi:hypothetical protein